MNLQHAEFDNIGLVSPYDIKLLTFDQNDRPIPLAVARSLARIAALEERLSGMQIDGQDRYAKEDLLAEQQFVQERGYPLSLVAGSPVSTG